MIVLLAAEAERDIEEIGDRIARENPVRAAGFICELRERCFSLAESPRRFPLVDRYEVAGIRRCLHGNSLIFYRIEGDGVTVAHVHDTDGRPDMSTTRRPDKSNRVIRRPFSPGRGNGDFLLESTNETGLSPRNPGFSTGLSPKFVLSSRKPP